MKRRESISVIPLVIFIFFCVFGFVSAKNILKNLDNRINVNPTGELRGTGLYNICDYGAVGDGKTLNTQSIQSAINACYKDSGGTVIIPAGDFLSGTIELKSNVTLRLANNGRLLGSDKKDDYIQGNGVPPGNGNWVFVYAANAKNITIEGRGTIDGDGANFFNGRGDGTGPGGQRGNMDRPHLIILYNCSNVFVHDVFLTRSAYHCFRILNCKYVRLDGIRIYNRVNKNNDGFHFNNTEYVNISNCNIKCQDDACALFGSNKFVTVTNCTFSTRWSIFRFGGGECENITVSNCVIYDTYGCPIKMSMGPRSRLENISFSNLIMKNVTGPISIGLDSRSRRRENDTSKVIPPKGIVRNISFNGIRAYVIKEPVNHPDIPFDVVPYPGETRQCIKLNGVGDSFLENISFTDVHVTYVGGGTSEEAAVRDVPQVAGEYFQMGTPPAYGMYVRNVKGLSLQNVSFDFENPDLRPAFILDGVTNASIDNFSIEGNENAESVMRFINSHDVLMNGVRLTSQAKIFLQTEGSDNSNIKIYSSDFSKAKKKLNFINGADSKMVYINN